MTGKRFKEIYPDIIRSNYCFTDNGEPIGDKEVCDLLNEQHETIGRLKENIDELSSVDIEEELLKENEQLKYDYNEKCNEYCGLEEQVDILLKENEQLKKVANDFAKNQTQHNLWKLRYVLKSGDVE